MTKFTVKEVTVFRVTTFWAKHSTKYNFFRIYEILNITIVQIWTAKCDFDKEW